MESMARVTPLPVGSMVAWLPSQELPAGWTWADGSTFNPEKYPELATVCEGGTLPNAPGDAQWPPYIIKTTTEHDPEPVEPESLYETGYREGAASAEEDAKTWKAQALREAADALPHRDGENTWWYTGWLRKRAEQVEAGEA